MRILLAGAFAYPLVVLLLAWATVLGVLDALYLAGLLVLLPTLALGQLALARDVVIERLPQWRRILVILVVVLFGEQFLAMWFARSR